MSDPLLPGARLGKYEVLAHIATGGMGSVYKALDVDLDRPVALKVLVHDRASNPVQQERFPREARHAARLNHKNIVTLYEYGQIEGTFFLALEFIEGIDLESYINRKGTLRPDLARHFAIQAARALEHAHQQGIVHRDIKPSNFLLQRREDRWIVKLTDMGLAWAAENADFRVTRAGSTVGTVDYLSPEQARDSSSVDIRSDLYSLGCTLYHMLAGYPPFGEGGLGERIYKHLAANPPDVREINPRVPDGLWLVLRKLLAKRPEDRYQTPTELKRDLKHLPSPADHDTKHGSASATSTSLPAAEQWEPGEEVPTGSSGSGVLAVAPDLESADDTPAAAVSDDQSQAASGQFQRAIEAADAGQNEYALQLLLSCCKLDPGNVMYRERLRSVGRFQGQIRGWFAPFGDLAGRRKVRSAYRAEEYRLVLERGEVMLLRRPDDIETHLLMAEAAEALGYEELMVWMLKQARAHSAPRDIESNRNLARMFERKQCYKEAIAMWERVHEAVPHDAEAPRKINALAVRETLDKGRYRELGARGDCG